MEATATMGLDVEVADASGQKLQAVNGLPPDSSVGELVQALLGPMNLPRNDPEGRALTYQARLEREGRHLHTSERVGDALQTGDRVTLLPNVDAGSGV